MSTVAMAFLIAGCSDPASDVHKSAASAPQESAAEATATAKTYTIQPDSKIGFVGSKVTGSHDGGFNAFSGTIPVADGKVASGAQIEIDMTSTWSDNDRLTGHLKSPDFFDVEKYPKSTFTITGVEAGATNSVVTGNLTLHGETKSISFPANIEVSESAVAVKAEFAINRKDFNINYPGRPDDLIRDNVVLKLDVKATPDA
jgi:polyisoprenoid-binding protein YceI